MPLIWLGHINQNNNSKKLIIDKIWIIDMLIELMIDIENRIIVENSYNYNWSFWPHKIKKII